MLLHVTGSSVVICRLVHMANPVFRPRVGSWFGSNLGSRVDSRVHSPVDPLNVHQKFSRTFHLFHDWNLLRSEKKTEFVWQCYAKHCKEIQGVH